MGRLILPQSALGNPADKKLNGGAEIRELFEGARFARVRSRFPVPVFLFNGRNISRSSTLSQSMECFAKTAHTGLVSWLGGGNASKNNFPSDGGVESSREEDIKLIRAQRIRYICDLMVEDRKRKYGIYVS